MTKRTLEELLSAWAGYHFGIGNISLASCPRMLLARDGRRAVVMGLGSSCSPGDNLRLTNGAFVELGRRVGNTDRFALWTVVHERRPV